MLCYHDMPCHAICPKVKRRFSRLKTNPSLCHRYARARLPQNPSSRDLAVVDEAETRSLALGESNATCILLPIALLEEEAEGAGGGARGGIDDGLVGLGRARGAELQTADLGVLDRLLVPVRGPVDLGLDGEQRRVVGAHRRLASSSDLELQLAPGCARGDVVEAESRFHRVGGG